MSQLRTELVRSIARDVLVSGANVDIQPLVDLVATLRSENGCPWDRRQTHQTLRRYIIEEAWEAAEAIDHGNLDALCEELGDLLLTIALQAQIATESGAFTLQDAIRGVVLKMVARHPHVFGEEEHHDDDVPRLWREQKANEGRSLLSGIPRSMPALTRAHAISTRAASVGFDWETAKDVIPKIREECDELEAAIEEDVPASSEIAEELGDLLFAVANLARKLNVDPEAALRGTTSKFERRFQFIENALSRDSRTVEDAAVNELEALWEQAKKTPTSKEDS